MSANVEGQLRQAIVTIRTLKQQVESLRGERHPAIAVVGIGCRFPGCGRGPEAFWDFLMAGGDGIVEVPADRWDARAWYDPDPEAPGKTNSRWGGFLADIDRFDADFFELSAREAAAMDPQQRLLLEVAWEALEDAAIAPDALARTAAGVFVGINGSDYYQMAMASPAHVDAHDLSGGVASVAAGRLSYLLGLNGPALAVDTACSSSLSAVHLAVASLRAGESKVALAGGVYTVLQPHLGVGLSRLRMLSPDGRCKTFDARADGFVQGEGCALVVLKRLDDAIADRDRVLAVIRGSAMNQDGRSASLTAPSRGAQAAVIAAALRDAGLAPQRVGYVETHGTGTALGDPIEVHALGDALGRERATPVVLGAVKSNIGHLGPAAGIAGLVKAVLAVRAGVIPPNLHLATVNPEIAAERMPMVLPAAPTAWPVEGPRAAGVSSFGFSGTNVHVVIEEAPAAHAADAPLPAGCAVLCASGRTPEAAAHSAADLARAMESEVDLAAASRASAFGRRAFEYRTAIVVRDAKSAAAALAQAAPVRVAPRPRLALRFADPASIVDATARLRALAAAFPSLRAALEKEGLALAGETAAGVVLQWVLVEQLRAWNLAPAACSGAGHGALCAAAAAGRVPWADVVKAFEDGHPERVALSDAHGDGRTALVPDADLHEGLRALDATIVLALDASVAVAAGPSLAAACAGGNPAELLAALAALHTHGLAPDWRRILGDGPRARLPLQPFQRSRHWRDITPAPGAAPSTGAWPPGERIASPSSDAQFRMAVGVRAMPWLGDHRVHGLAVAPGAFQLACLAGAWRARHGEGACRIEDIGFARPLVAPEEGAIELWTLVTAQGEAKLASESEGRWIEYAQAHLSPATAAPEARDLAGIRARCTRIIETARWRDQLAVLGISIGPAFQGIRELRQGDGESLAQVSLPAGCAPPAEGWHPALLDACLQAAGATFAEATRTGEALLPVGIDRVDFTGRLEGTLWAHARRTNEGDVLSADVAICGADGNVRVLVTGLHVRRAPAARVHDDACRELFHRVEWKPAPVRAERAEGPLLVLAQGDVASELAARLGSRAVIATGEAIEMQAARLGEDAEIVDARSWHREGWDGLDACREAFEAAAVLARRERPPRLTLVTRGARHGTHPAHGALWGLAATLALEHPALRCRVIDAADLAAAARELALPPDGEGIVAASADARLVPRIVRTPAPRTLPVRLRDTALITGGLGGIGRAVARWAVERGASHVVLVSRRGPDADARAFAASLGAPATLVRADVGRRDEVARMLREIRSAPPLRNVCHAAGAQAEGLLASIPWEAFDAALDGKLRGAAWLDLETRALALDHFVLFSSIAAHLGAAGQGGYAAANAGLDALARHRRAAGVPATSIAWGRWAGAGMAQALDEGARRRIDALGIGEMQPAVALAALDRALAAELAEPLVAAVDWEAYRARHPAANPPRLLEGTGAGAAAQTERVTLPGDFGALDAQARFEALAAFLEARVAAALQSPPGRRLDRERPLVQLGLDSLLAMELRNALQKELGATASIAQLLGGASVGDIARSLEPALPRRDATPAAPEWEEFRL